MLQAFFTERLLTDFLYSCYIPSPTSLLLGLAYNRIVLSVALNNIGLSNFVVRKVTCSSLGLFARDKIHTVNTTAVRSRVSP